MPGRSGRDDRQGVRSFGAPLGAAAPADEPVQRNAPRPASDSQVKAALAANDSSSKSESKAGLYKGSSPTPPASSGPSGTDPATRDLSAQGAANKIVGGIPRIDKAVEDAGG